MRGAQEPESEAARFFTLLTRIRQRFLEFQRALWERYEPKTVREQHWISPAYYLNGPTYEEYIVLATAPDISMTWCFSLGWRGERWLIEMCVLVDDVKGERTLKEFPEAGAVSLQELRSVSEHAIDELFGADVLPTQ